MGAFAHSSEPCQIGSAPRRNGLLKGPRHERQIAAGGDGGVGHDGGGAHLHGLAGLGGTTNASIDDDGQVDFFNQNLDKVPGAQSLVAANGRAQGHDAGGACVSQGACNLQIGVHIGHDHKALLGQHLRCFNGFVIVRQQIFAVANDLDFYKIALAYFPGQARNAHRLIGGAGTGGVGEQGDAFGHVIQDIGQRPAVGAAQGQGEDFGTGLLHSGLNELQGIFAGAQNKTGGEFMSI